MKQRAFSGVLYIAEERGTHFTLTSREAVLKKGELFLSCAALPTLPGPSAVANGAQPCFGLCFLIMVSNFAPATSIAQRCGAVDIKTKACPKRILPLPRVS